MTDEYNFKKIYARLKAKRDKLYRKRHGPKNSNGYGRSFFGQPKNHKTERETDNERDIKQFDSEDESN